MKKHITALILCALFMIGIPLMTVKNTSFNSNTENKRNNLTNFLAYEFREEYCDEALKAIAIILNSNYKSKANLKSISKKEFIKKHKNGEYHYSKLEKIASQAADKCITYQKKPATIPYAYITNGNCESDYPYLRNTANPWDCVHSGFKTDGKSGVSFNSINVLCKKGLSYKECIGRYVLSKVTKP